MSTTLRVVLLLCALVAVIWILKKIYKSKVRLGDAIFWFCMAVILAVLGLFPDIAAMCSRLIGIETPVNFVFLFILALVIEKLFTLSIKVSQLEDKITILSAEVALRSKDTEDRIRNIANNSKKKISSPIINRSKQKRYNSGYSGSHGSRPIHGGHGSYSK